MELSPSTTRCEPATEGTRRSRTTAPQVRTCISMPSGPCSETCRTSCPLREPKRSMVMCLSLEDVGPQAADAAGFDLEKVARHHVDMRVAADGGGGDVERGEI